MHESGLSEAIVATALRHAGGRRVTRVRVRIGGHPVDPDVVTQGVQLAAMGSAAENTAVELVLVPMSVSCRGCGRGGSVEDHLSMVACPACGGVDIEVTGDEDVILESITVANSDVDGIPEEEEMASR
jgi:hydrogenase nickel incorporation protein HypA/HybF